MKRVRCKVPMNYLKYLITHGKLFLFPFISITIVLLIVGAFHQIYPTYSLKIAIYILTTFDLLIILGYTITFAFGRDIIVLGENTFNIPNFKKGRDFIQTVEKGGYTFDHKQDNVLVLSDYCNIKKVWVVENHNEILKLTKNKDRDNTKDFTAIPIINVGTDPKTAIKIVDKYEKDKEKYHDKIVRAINYHNVYDVKKTIGIELKKLEYRFPSIFPKKIQNSELSKVYKELLYPKLKNITVYVSVKDPEKVVEEIKKKMKLCRKK